MKAVAGYPAVGGGNDAAAVHAILASSAAREQGEASQVKAAIKV